MTKEQNDKLVDYIGMIKGVASSGFFSIASVIISDENYGTVIGIFREEKFSIIDIDEYVNPHLVLKCVIDLIKQEEDIVLNMRSNILKLITDLLRGLSDNCFNMRLAGDTENTVLIPASYDSKIVIITTDDIFEQSNIQRFVTSTCRL